MTRDLLLTTVRAAGTILAKELRLEFRTRELLTATVIFALVVRKYLIKGFTFGAVVQ